MYFSSIALAYHVCGPQLIPGLEWGVGRYISLQWYTVKFPILPCHSCCPCVSSKRWSLSSNKCTFLAPFSRSNRTSCPDLCFLPFYSTAWNHLEVDTWKSISVCNHKKNSIPFCKRVIALCHATFWRLNPNFLWFGYLKLVLTTEISWDFFLNTWARFSIHSSLINTSVWMRNAPLIVWGLWMLAPSWWWCLVDLGGVASLKEVCHWRSGMMADFGCQFNYI